MTPTEACIALNMLPTMGPVRLRKLLKFSKLRNAFSRRARRVARGRRNRQRSGGSDRQLGRAWSILPAELERIRQFGAKVITAESPLYPRQLREIHAPPDRALRLGRTDRARSTRHRGHWFAAHDPLRNGVGEEAFLSARLRGSHRDQRTGAWDRYRRASGRARGQRPHDCRDRFRLVETLSARERRSRGEDSRAATARSFRSSPWRSNPTAKRFRCATESSAAGAMAFSSSKRA